MVDARYPHQLLERYVADRLGRRADLFGPLADDLFVPLVRAVSDQLSVYLDVRPFAHLRVGDATLREGAERSYVLVGLTDRGAPLRLRAVFEHWDMPVPSNRDLDWADMVNGRRWRFVDRHLGAVIEPLLLNIADSLTAFYQRKPGTAPTAGLIRFCEGIDATHLVVEVDEKAEATPQDRPGRYAVQ